MELECMVDLSTDDKVYENSLLIKEIEKELNVKIKLIPEPTGTADDIRKAMNLQIASGDFPDFIPNVKFPDYYAYAQQGLLAEIPVDMIKSEAPGIIMQLTVRTTSFPVSGPLGLPSTPWLSVRICWRKPE